ncbi:MAG: hypothetical protein IKE94_09165 [Aeriscardovia sp.]|nr:hypothetical protein [Aeriscardovia sp.]MBR2755087.1 hypothetical protein [Lachnospiraceae bacterium]
MNTLTIKARHIGLNGTICQVNTVIDCSQIKISSKKDELTVVIITRKKKPAALSLFFDIFSLVFIYLGAFPLIKSVTFNNTDIDTSLWIDKYKTRYDLFRKSLFISNLNNATVNQYVLDEYRRKQILAIYSLQYLTSEAYTHMVSDHRITLLLHVIDGICEINNKEEDLLLTEIIKKYRIPKSKKQLGSYISKVYMVSKECFFYYHRKYNSTILPLLKVNQYSFLQIIADTRNWNSHFLRDKKPNRLKRGNEIVIYIELIQYMIRLKVAKDIGVDVLEENIKEYYYIIHDWILKVLYDKDDDLKSNTYISSKQWDDFIKQIKPYSDNSTIIESI